MRIKPMLQLARTECGLCCVAMICRYYGKGKTVSYYRQFLKSGRDGSSAKDVFTLLVSNGVNASLKLFDAHDLDRITGPAIVMLDNNHFVILEKNRGRNTVVVVDPAIGRFKLNKSELIRRIGKIIILTRNSEMRLREKLHCGNYELQCNNELFKIGFCNKFLPIAVIISEILHKFGILIALIYLKNFIDLYDSFTPQILCIALVFSGFILMMITLQNYLTSKMESVIED